MSHVKLLRIIRNSQMLSRVNPTNYLVGVVDCMTQEPRTKNAEHRICNHVSCLAALDTPQNISEQRISFAERGCYCDTIHPSSPNIAAALSTRASPRAGSLLCAGGGRGWMGSANARFVLGEKFTCYFCCSKPFQNACVMFMNSGLCFSFSRGWLGYTTAHEEATLVSIGEAAEHVRARRIHPDRPISEPWPAVAVDNRVSTKR